MELFFGSKKKSKKSLFEKILINFPKIEVNWQNFLKDFVLYFQNFQKDSILCSQNFIKRKLSLKKDLLGFPFSLLQNFYF